jgi:hypothetical protein
MRRFYLLLTGAGVLGLALGCHHVAGKCDCDIPAPGVITGGYPHPGAIQPTAATAQATATGTPAPPTMSRAAEDLKELPKPKEKDKDMIPPGQH